MARKQLKFDIKAENRSDRAFAGVRKNADKTAKHVQGRFKGLAGSLGGGIVGGLVGVIGVAKVVRGATSALEEFDLLAKKARTRGLSTDFYQGLKVGATEAGVALSVVESSLLAYVKRVGEAKAGLGPLVSGLKKSNPVLLENIRNSQSQEKALKLLADAIQKSSSATEKAALANAAFGRSGIEMVRILSDGATGLDVTMQKARKLGLVIDKELLTNAEKVNNEFGLVNDIIGVNFKSVLVTLSPIILAFTKKLAGLARSLNDTFGSFGSGGVSGLERQLKKKYASALDLQGTIRKLESEGASPGFIRQLKFNRDDYVKEIKALKEVLRFKRAAEKEVIANNKRFSSPQSRLPELGGKTKLRRQTQRPHRDVSADLARQQQERIEGVISALTFEAAQLGRTAQEQRIYNELKSAGVLAGSKEGQTIAGLVGQIDRETTALEERNKQLGFARDLTSDALFDISGGLKRGEGLWKSFQNAGVNALDSIANALLNSGLNSINSGLFGNKSSGGGLFGNIFGGLFKGFPGFATGGSFEVGGRGGIDNNLVAFRATKGEQVSITPPGRRGAAGNSVGAVHFSTHIDASGSNMSEAQLNEILDRRDRELKASITPTIRDAMSRGQFA